ncbi:MAG: DUF3369 domain-containing protein [Candidatus Hydrogenedentes bacterium]|nr:DUF3369 domain-containing protein [Candidatus Hydrogenedentota bacterium]
MNPLSSTAEEESDDLLFVNDDEAPEAVPELTQPWKVMIVDDEAEVHNVTRLVLEGFQFAERGLDLISAYSAAEAREKIALHPDLAMVLLDVVMETEDAGLRFAQYVREDLRNAAVRIVLRTGQPGQAPEEQVILNYDINDYKAKTELTSTKLFTTMVASLRSYRHLQTLETNKRGLQTILQASSSIFESRAMEQFSSGVLTQLTALLNLKEDALYCKTSGFAAASQDGVLRIVSGTGIYENFVSKTVDDITDPEIMRCLESAREQRQALYLDDNRYVGYFYGDNGSENLLYLHGWKGLNQWDRYLLEIFCRNVAIAYDNISLNNEILETQREIIFKLGEIVENRSRETGNHVKRVAEYCGVLARAAGLSSDEAAVLRFASPMHDLGKMAIPDSILKKPGKLTDEEMDVMKSHTTIGYDMLRHSKRELLGAAATIALQHHERHDGKGYPNGLQGHDIHIYARIASIADVFDALGVKRVYKDAWPMEEILAHFHAQRGTQFDPELVDVFFNSLDSLIAIRDAFPDVSGEC